MIAADFEIPVIDDCWNRIGVWSRAMPRCPRLEVSVQTPPLNEERLRGGKRGPANELPSLQPPSAGREGERSRLGQVIHCHRCEVYAAAGRRLRDRPLPSDYREDWRQHYARTIPRRGADPLTAVLVFRIGGEWLALPADAVEEILDPVPVHSLPHRAPGAIQGLANIHGRLRPCASLAALLGIEPRAPVGLAPDRRRVYSRMVAIRRENGRFAFAADDVWGCHRHAAADLREAPATLARALARFTLGILPLEDKAVGRLDADLLFHALEKDLA